MTWSADQKYRPESCKIVWEVAPYLRGKGFDIGAGSFKILPHATSVDNCVDHELFGMQFTPDENIENAEDMSKFETHSLDWVYSSHLLEHLVNPEKALKEWWRLVKPNGYLILYLPHEDLYPKIGEEGANIDHKWNLNEQKVIDWMYKIGGWDLEVCDKRDQDEEYSFLLIFRKLRGNKHHYSHKLPKPKNTVCVVRYGAFGDMIQTSTVIAGLKKQGYHVTVFCSPPGSDVILHDPNIDKMVLFDKDQVPNADLGGFWEWQEKKFDKFVNLSESVEGTLLAIAGRAPYKWSPIARHSVMNHNYVQTMHEIAGVPHDPQIKFYPTSTERVWAERQRKSMKFSNLVMWSLAGSSVHKTWSGLDNIMASILVAFPDTAVMLVGGPECEILEAGWENEPRVYRTCGKFNIRQTLSMLSHVDVLIGPETGVLNAAACMDMEKICFLSHSTHENLTRDWKNVTPVWSEDTTCPGRGKNEAPACHQLQFGFTFCKRDEQSGTAQCMADVSIQQVWIAVEAAMLRVVEQKRRAA